MFKVYSLLIAIFGLCVLPVHAGSVVIKKTEVSIENQDFWFDDPPASQPRQDRTRHCVRHAHGSHWHDCHNPEHPAIDETHSHMGLPTYQVLRQTYRFYSFYFGVKGGVMQMDSDDTEAGMPFGFLAGLGGDDFSVEFEVTSASTGMPAELGRRGAVFDSDAKYSTVGLYGVRRLGDALYTKVKLGFVRNTHQSDFETLGENSVSGGIGVGMNRGAIKLEGEYTYLGPRARLISFGVNYFF